MSRVDPDSGATLYVPVQYLFYEVGKVEGDEVVLQGQVECEISNMACAQHCAISIPFHERVQMEDRIEDCITYISGSDVDNTLGRELGATLDLQYERNWLSLESKSAVKNELEHAVLPARLSVITDGDVQANCQIGLGLRHDVTLQGYWYTYYATCDSDPPDAVRTSNDVRVILCGDHETSLLLFGMKQCWTDGVELSVRMVLN